jgi:hypothetical protein
VTRVIDAEYEEMNDTEDELDLSADTSLPWLESDEEDSEAGALDTRQIIMFAALLLTLLAVLVGAVWYVSNKLGSASLEPDGSVIAAPEGPVKVRPQDPGGKQFAGTGNVAPLVGEGGTPQAVVASNDRPAPILPDPPAPSKPVPVAGPAEPAPASTPAVISGIGVQLAAYSSRARAEQGWSDLSRRSETLQAVRHRVVEGRVDSGIVYRLQAVAADRASADQLCATLKTEGLDCQVKP